MHLQTRTNFISINDAFNCQNCGHQNPPLPGGCRNHCQKCLFSLHVDEEIPGDRLSDCHGLMKPIKADYSGKKGHILIHQCQTCRKQMRNKLAADDNLEVLYKIQSES